MNRLTRAAGSIAPLVIIAGLLYAGLFIKPVAPTTELSSAVIGLRDSFYGIAVPEPKVLWAVGRDGKVVRSEDAGEHWVAQTIPVAVNLQSIAAWDAQHAVAVGNLATVISTADAGKSWKPGSGIVAANPFQKLIRARITSPTQALVVGEFGAMWRTDDRGATWRPIGQSEDVAWHDIAVPSEQILVAVGEFGRIVRSTDGGGSWTPVSSPVKTTLTALRFRDAQNAVAVGLEGVILTTADAGVSWQRIDSPTREHLFDVTPADAANSAADAWLAVGDKGLLLRGNGGAWTAARLKDGNYAWHMQIVPVDGRLYLAGAQLARFGADQQLTRFR